MAPEIKLLLMISGSALKFHLSNTVINSLPNLGDTLNNNPELAEKLRQKAKQQADIQRESLNKFSSKEHDIAAQKAMDLQQLKDNEMEYLKMQHEMAQKKQYEELQQKLKQSIIPPQQPLMKPPQQPLMKPPQMPPQMKLPQMTPQSMMMPTQQPLMRAPQMTNQQMFPQMVSTQQQAVTVEDFEAFKKQQLMNQYAYLQQLKNVEDIIQTETEKSAKSSKSSKTSKSSKSSKSIKIGDLDDNHSTASSVSFNANINNIIERTKNKMNNVKIETVDDETISKKSDVSFGSKRGKKKSSSIVIS
jgi:hypothetical protein